MIIYLYVKQHTITGLKYFGKTKAIDPFSYPGTGIKWKRHWKKYGKEYIKTLDVYGFDNQEDATSFALNFSKEHNIVASDEWANLIPEDALAGGGNKGMSPSAETRLKISKGGMGKILSEEHKKKISDKMKGQPKSADAIANMSRAQSGRASPLKGKKRSPEFCRKISETKLAKRKLAQKDSHRQP